MEKLFLVKLVYKLFNLMIPENFITKKERKKKITLIIFSSSMYKKYLFHN